jgi:DeoR/GlpR family transcriptional regulator of sugar metabolism
LVASDDADELRYRNAVDRRTRVRGLVQAGGFVRISDLSAMLGVSRITIRRDVQQLEGEGLVRGTRGGVLDIPAPGRGSHFRLRATRSAHVKALIARTAAQYIKDRGFATIGIDAGTTALAVARVLQPDRAMTVVTHSISSLSAVANTPYVEVVCIGGVLHSGTQSFAGPATVAGYSQVRLSVAVLGATAVGNLQMLCGNDYDAVTKQMMMSVAETTMLLVDSSKFGLVSPFFVGDISSVGLVVTDDGLSEEHKYSLLGTGVEVIVVDVQSAGQNGGSEHL